MPILDEQDDVVLLLHRADDITDYVTVPGRRPAGRGTGGRPGGRAGPAGRGRSARPHPGARTGQRGPAGLERTRTAHGSTLAGLATTVSALSAAESRAELLRQMFRHARAPCGPTCWPWPCWSPAAATWPSWTPAAHRSPEPVQRLPVRSPAADGRRSRRPSRFQEDADRGDGRRPRHCPACARGRPSRCASARRPLGSLTVGWDGRSPSPTTTSACSRPSPRSAPRRSTGSPGGRPSDGRHRATRSLAETLQRSLLTDPPRARTPRHRRPLPARRPGGPDRRRLVRRLRLPCRVTRRSSSVTSPATTGPPRPSPDSCATCSAASPPRSTTAIPSRCSVRSTAR